MSKFEELARRVDMDEVRLIQIEAVPRSVSTALGRALAESDTPSLYINEPFNRMRHDIEDATDRILREVLPALDTTDTGLTVVTKNMARNLSVEHHRAMAEISDGVVWSVRKPIFQIGALMTRIANDLLYESGADVIPQGALTDEQIALASQFLEEGPTSTNFSKTSWSSLGEHFNDTFQPDVSLVVDGSIFTNNPEQVLEFAANSLGLVYSSRMVDGWQNDFVNANTGYNPAFNDGTHAWTRDAAGGTGIKPVDDVPIDIERLPRALRRHVEDVANPTYEEMMRGA